MSGCVARIALYFSLAVLASVANPAKGLAEVPFRDGSDKLRLFGFDERPSFNIWQFPKWTSLLHRYGRERSLETQACAGSDCKLQQWHVYVESLRGQSASDQLNAVHSYVNRIPYLTNAMNYGLQDYWATPREILARGADCEDYATLKYLSLRNLGWDMNNARIVIVLDTRRRVLHAVLAVWQQHTILILDNLLPARVDHRSIAYYRPIYSINEFGWWYHAQSGSFSGFRQDSISLLAQCTCRGPKAMALLERLQLLAPARGADK